MLPRTLFPLLAASTVAEVHYLFSGFFSGSTIAGIEFDDEALSLNLVKNISAVSDDGSKWIALDAHKQNLYVGTTGYLQSYKIAKDLGLTYKSNVSLSSDCNNANFITASSKSLFTVFGTPYGGGCPTVAISVDKTGTLQKSFANATYNSKGGVHGTSLSPKNDFLYSADDMGNAVWVHSYDRENGKVEEVQYLAAEEGSNPRHLTDHPNGKWVYVVYEEANSIAAYKRDTKTGKLEFRNETFTNSSSYWADEVLLFTSAEGSSPKYLLAATRSRKTGVPGYVSAFSLDAKTGGIKEQMFLQETTNSGGSANAVSPASFSEDFFAITDSGSNFIEIWKIKDKSASAVAHLDLENGPANVTPIGEVRSRVSEAIDSGFGTTFDAHIMAGYRFLMRYYPRRIYRQIPVTHGNEVGLLCKGNEETVPFAYRLYQRSLQCKSDDRTKAMGYCARNSPSDTVVSPSDTKAPESQTTGSRRSETAPLNGDGGSSCSSTDHEEDSDGPVEDIYLAGNPVITPSAKGIAAEKEVQAFSDTFCRDEGGGNIKVFFLGLWDCVNSVAMVERSAPAPVEITGTAHHVRHAVAVDERRVKFKPALLAQDIKTVVKAAETSKTGDKQNKAVIDGNNKGKKEEEDIREVWFPGNHGDVGGGWPAIPTGLEVWRLWKYIFSGTKVDNLGEPLKDENLQMSDMALEWMIREKSMNVAEAVKERITNGFMHNTLRFGYGSSFLKVFMWNLIKTLPGIPRWELND
ncbi:carboxy-cis cis-muconate cyclase [Fusarium subglutinans]|uniref:Carboxy-cis cis-muconate cyclase n=1 Tax=Gibberella subglutinans TaxID=42677 RepID=A0A8H5P5C1_GIBSU|nr:carboxy-cis cis-muconate cyclase [Fusarium subglutinans]KAF5587005.1 carboxy-cis cis-muconate cyclase [Fusarium subglutinans]